MSHWLKLIVMIMITGYGEHEQSKISRIPGFGVMDQINRFAWPICNTDESTEMHNHSRFSYNENSIDDNKHNFIISQYFCLSFFPFLSPRVVKYNRSKRREAVLSFNFKINSGHCIWLHLTHLSSTHEWNTQVCSWIHRRTSKIVSKPIWSMSAGQILSWDY